MVGSIIISHQNHRTIRRLTFDWLSDAAGAVSGLLSPDVSGKLMCVVFTPDGGGTQPTDLYDVTLVDEDGFDVLQGKGANLSNVNASNVVPLVGDGTTTNQRVALDGVLELMPETPKAGL